MSNTAQSRIDNKTESNDEEPIDPKLISDALNNNDEAKDIMEKMFSSLLTNPELSSALMNPEIAGMLSGLGGLGATLNTEEEAEKDTKKLVESTSTPDGLEDITSSIQESSKFPHEIEKTITELEETTRNIELRVKFESNDVRALYDTDSGNKQYDTDSGWDLKFKEDITVPAGALSHKIDFGVSVCCYDYNFDERALWLVPRSSIVNTPLRLANSVGLIDSSYRGTLRAYVDNRNIDKPYTLKKGERLFQIAVPSLQPFALKVVNELPNTERGEHGFGSTGA